MPRAPRIFTTLPRAAISDTGLTALDLRVLAVIALHDGMSAISGKGGGCYAKNLTLAALVRTDPTNFSKSLSRLIRIGYVTREPQLMDKRRFTLRVQYPADDCWRTDQQFPPQYDGETGEIVGEAINPPPEIVGEADSENDRFSKESDRHYISLKEELDSVETEKIHSLKGRHSGFPKTDAPKGGLPRVSLKPHLPTGFEGLASTAQVPAIERAFKAIGSDPQIIERGERDEISALLFTISEAFAGEPTGQQAGRLWGEIAPF
jgi:hypothetical protein